jgi:hypothetical protein
MLSNSFPGPTALEIRLYAFRLLTSTDIDKNADFNHDVLKVGTGYRDTWNHSYLL